MHQNQTNQLLRRVACKKTHRVAVLAPDKVEQLHEFHLKGLAQTCSRMSEGNDHAMEGLWDRESERGSVCVPGPCEKEDTWVQSKL